MKICTCCKLELDKSNFRKQKRGKNGLRSQCYSCEKQKRKIRNQIPEVKEYHNKKHREYTLKNKEVLKNYDREFRNKYHKSIDGYGSKLYSGALSRAKKKGIDFSLTSDWVREKVSHLKCEVTGFELTIKPGENCKSNPLQPTLDRIDNSKGYTIENTRVTCWWYNVMKQDWTDEIINKLIKDFYEFRDR